MYISALRFFFVCIMALVLVRVFSLSFSYFTAQATVYNLYATTCLGGWENPHLATGAPEAFRPNGSVFNDANSARLSGDVHAQIYCGGFAGEIRESTIPKRILVKFSASTAEPEAIQPEESPIVPETPEVVEPEEVPEDTEEATVPVEELVEEPAPEEPSAEEPTPEEPTPEESVPEEPTISLFNFFVNIARAQETEVQETPLVAPTEEIEGEEVVEDESTSNPEEAITPEGGTENESTPYGIAEILYTLDGVAWRTLGFVEKDEFGSTYFEIPIEEASAWEDISKIQIGIQSVPVIDGIVPIMYLDSVWLEVSYDDLEEISIEEEIVLEEELYEEILEEEEEIIEEIYEINENPISNELNLKTRTFNDFVVDENAIHYCSSADFSINLTVDSPVTHSMQLLGATAGQGIQLAVGSLPLGIDVFFSENKEYEISLPTDRGGAEVEMSMQEGAQRGNFTIPIIFTLQKADGNSTAVCQINVVNL
jgi:hypothetical protein